jgi:hypothetical protein
LVGNYGSTEHRACISQLHHGLLNHVFELPDVKYQLWPEPIAHGLKNARVQKWKPH